MSGARAERRSAGERARGVVASRGVARARAAAWLRQTDRNLNFAFRVASAANSERSVFVKCAPEYIKCLGPEAKLSSSRAALESDVLSVHNELAPAFTPRKMHFDKERAIIVMEDLQRHVLLRDELLAGRVHEGDARALGRFMGLTHSRTWRDAPGVPSAEYAARFSNELLCGITSQYIFVKPYDEADGSNRCSEGLKSMVAALRAADSPVRAAAAERNSAFLHSKRCLIHGDLHSGSVMVSRAPEGSGEAAEPEPGAYDAGRLRVFDPEFACYGSPAFDAGLALAAYAFAFHHHRACGHTAVLPRIERAMAELWASYATHLTALSGGTAATGALSPKLALLRESTGFMGAELVRRVIGAAHVPDLESIADEGARLDAERAVLAVGSAALLSWHGVSAIDDVITLVAAGTSASASHPTSA